MTQAILTDSLRSIREQSRLKIAEVLERAQKVDPEFPTTHAGYLGIEEMGTRDYWKIRALSVVFGVPLDRMAEITLPERCRK